MNEDQKFAFDLSVSGHNLLISGQAGTGKTYLVKEIVKQMRSDQKNVAVVCSTGIASRQYKELGSSTLHKWAGIQDGRYLNEEIVHLVKTDEKFSDAKRNIESVETLIIDEISMISSKTLNQVETLCRHIRGSTVLFGNIQVIIVGDFFQLPPVSNELYGDSGNHCFSTTCSWFENMFPHKINLHKVHRQDEPTLIKCVNELEKGSLSDESTAFLNSLNRPLKNEESSVHLFARNIDVDLLNYNKLQQLPGETKVYSSKDEGSSHYLNKFLAPKNLGLKVKSPVMLIKNLSDELVNGTIGEVTTLHENSIDVTFDFSDKPITVNIVPVSFTTFDPVTKIVLAQRVQLPLKLAHAFTIHKSQGMSLPNLIVHCEHIFQPGQLGVAVGRAVSVEGLKIVNFKKSVCKRHPEHVYRFYESFTVGEVKQDLSCCRHTANKTAGLESKSDDIVQDGDDIIANESDFSDIEIEILENMENDPLHFENLSIQALNSVVSQFIDSPAEQQVKLFQCSVQRNAKPYDEWFEEQFSVIEGIGLDCFPEKVNAFTQKHRNDFVIKFNEYINSETFTSSAQSLLNVYKQDQTGPAFRVIVSMLFYLEQRYVESLESHLQLQPPEPLGKPAADAQLDPVGRGKIRYVSGYVLAKLKYNLSKNIRNSLFVKGKEKQLISNQSKMEILNSLCCSYDEILMSSTDCESLEEIQRKQNQREGLTNITDEAFEFFKTLEIQCRQNLTHKNLVSVGKSLFNVVKVVLLSDMDLYEKWLQCVVNARKTSIGVESEAKDDIEEILSTIVTTCDYYKELFNSIVDLFLKVSLSQFRRDYLVFLKNEKGKALRKKVMEKSKSKTSFTVNFFEDDESVHKEASYLRLKSELLQNRNFLEESPFTVKHLLALCKTFEVKVIGKKKKSDVIKLLVDKVLESDKALSGEDLQSGTSEIEVDQDLPVEQPQPGTSEIEIDKDLPGEDPQTGTSGITTASRSETVAATHPSSHSEPVAETPPSSHSEPVAATPPFSHSEPAAATKTRTVKQRKGIKGKGKGKAKGKGKGKSRGKVTQTTDESDENCAVCYKSYIEGEDWISCDLCSLWYHRECVSLHDADEWLKYSEEEEPFICPMCL